MSQKGTFLPVDAYGAYGQLRSSPSTASNSAKRTETTRLQRLSAAVLGRTITAAA